MTARPRDRAIWTKVDRGPRSGHTFMTADRAFSHACDRGPRPHILRCPWQWLWPVTCGCDCGCGLWAVHVHVAVAVAPVGLACDCGLRPAACGHGCRCG